MALDIRIPRPAPPTEVDDKPNISIVQILAEDKFYITKTANIDFLVTAFRKAYRKYFYRGGVSSSDMFYPLLRHIDRHKIDRLKIEVLFSSTNGYLVLKYELEYLMEWFGKKECLNENNIPHIPKTVYAKKGSNWLTMNQSLNFRKLLTKYDY